MGRSIDGVGMETGLGKAGFWGEDEFVSPVPLAIARRAKHRSGSRPTVCSSAAGRTRQWVTVCPTLVRRSRNEPTESSRGSIDTRFGEEARSLVTARTRRVPTETGLPAPVRHGLSADCPILIFKAGRTHRNAESPPSEGCRDLDV